MALLLPMLVSCQDNSQTKKGAKKVTIITAKKQAIIKDLYFSGVLEPIKTIPVLSPVQGRVVKLHFKYGQHINKNQHLVKLSSTQLATDYRKAIQNYLQKKNTFTTGMESFTGTKALYKAGVISRSGFLTAQST